MSNFIARYYKPKAQQGESPGSIFLRSTSRHYELPSTVLRAGNVTTDNAQTAFKKAISGDTTLIEKLADISNWQPSPVISHFAAKKLHRRFVNFWRIAMCPACAEEGHLPTAHDLACIDTCTKHRLKLRTHCHACKLALKWSRLGLGTCTCMEPIRFAEAANSIDLAYARFIETLFNDANVAAIQSLVELKSTLETRYHLSVPTAKTMAMEIASGKNTRVASFIAGIHAQNPELPRALLFSPIAKWLNSRHLKAPPKNLAANVEKVDTSKIYFKKGELQQVLHTKPKTLAEITKSVRRIRGVKGAGFDVLDLESANFLFRSLRAKEVTASKSMSLRELANNSGKTIPFWIEQVLTGKYLVTQRTDTQYLADTVINHHVEPNDDVPEGYLTHKEATKYTELYGAVLSALRELKWVKFEYQPVHNNRYIYEKASLDRFLATYTTAGRLAESLRMQPRTLAEKLVALGIEPAAKPSGCTDAVYIFRLSDVEKISPSDLADVSAHYSTSGRPKKEAARLDSQEWLTAAETASLLGVSTQQLKRFITRGLLVVGQPDEARSSRTRYFTTASTRTTKLFIDQLTKVDDLASELTISRKKMLRRLLRMDENALITINEEQYIMPDAAKNFRRACNNLWTSEDAAAFLGCSPFDIGNWVRLGHITPIDTEHPSYLGKPRLFEKEVVERFAKDHTLASRPDNLKDLDNTKTAGSGFSY